MKLLATTAICGLAVLGASAAWADMVKVGSIEVKTNLAAFENSNALEYWGDIEQDLGAALAQRIDVTDLPKDDSLIVTITGIMLNGNPMLPAHGEFNQLDGTIALFEAPQDNVNKEHASTDGAAADSYALKVYTVTEETVAPEGAVVIEPDKDDYYHALVDGFAIEVAHWLDKKS